MDITCDDYLWTTYSYEINWSILNKNNITLTEISDCRTQLSDRLYHDHWTNKKEEYKLLLLIDNSKFHYKFNKNIKWFNSWQKFLGLKPIKITKNITINAINKSQTYPYGMILELDPHWFSSIFANNFVTFILKTMCFHIYKSELDFKSLQNDVEEKEYKYLYAVGRDYTLFLFNHIIKLHIPYPFGKKNDDFITYHHSYGVFDNYDYMARKYDLSNFTTLTSLK